MGSFIDVVSLVISYFVEWFSSISLSLIQNPVIQLVFAFPVVFGIFYFIVNLIVSIFNRGNTGTSNYSGGFDDGYDDPSYGPNGDLYDGTYDTGPF